MNQGQLRSIFTELHYSNHWDTWSTRSLHSHLPELLRISGIEHMVDIGCGNFSWLRRINISGVSYLGIDIVSAIVTSNRGAYSGPNVKFREMDLISSKLPLADLIFCRDVMVHFPDDLIVASIQNIKRSGSTYLLATTFPDIRETPSCNLGEWRPVNLCDSKFGLPEPSDLIEESRGDTYGRKCMGLWYIGDL
jgi:SAM-dependent methyltransferase